VAFRGIKQRHRGAASENSEIRFDQNAIGFLIQLAKDLAPNQVVARNASKVCDESRGLHQAVQIDVHRVGKILCLWVHDQHLARVHEDGFTNAVFEEHPPGAFEHDELDISVGVILQHDRCAGN